LFLRVAQRVVCARSPDVTGSCERPLRGVHFP
jgi:hypothetical protein